jgi:hypothetical protein
MQIGIKLNRGGIKEDSGYSGKPEFRNDNQRDSGMAFTLC